MSTKSVANSPDATGQEVETDGKAPPAKSHAGAFMGGALLGAVAGVGLGIAAWLVLFGAFGVLAGGAGILAAMATGAAGMALYEGNKAVKRAKFAELKGHAPDDFKKSLGTAERAEEMDAGQRTRYLYRPSTAIRDSRKEIRRERREERHDEHRSFVERLMASRDDDQNRDHGR